MDNFILYASWYNGMLNMDHHLWNFLAISVSEINLVKVLDQTSKLEETQGKEEQVKQNMRKQADKSRMSDIQEKITLE